MAYGTRQDSFDGLTERAGPEGAVMHKRVLYVRIDMRTPVIPPERREGMHVGLFVFSCVQPLFLNFPFAFSEVYLDFFGAGVVWEGKKKNIAIDRLATGVPWCRMASGDPDIDMITYGYIGLLHVDAPEKALLGPGKFLLGTRFGPANPVAFPFICQVVEREKGSCGQQFRRNSQPPLSFWPGCEVGS